MKIKEVILAIAIILILSSVSGAWIFQSGLVFLFGALSLYLDSKKKGFNLKKITVGVMFILTVWGFFNGMWNLHPFGMIISIAGCVWVSYEIYNKQLKSFDEIKK